jgi:hypothetical protein
VRSILLEDSKRSGGVRVICRVLAPDERGSLRVVYSTVKRFNLVFPPKEALFDEQGDGLGSWGYDEVSRSEDGGLLHEILLSTGTIVVIGFSKVSCSKESE